jgi:hypothetical protein
MHSTHAANDGGDSSAGKYSTIHGMNPLACSRCCFKSSEVDEMKAIGA